MLSHYSTDSQPKLYNFVHVSNLTMKQQPPFLQGEAKNTALVIESFLAAQELNFKTSNRLKQTHTGCIKAQETLQKLRLGVADKK